MAYFNAKLVCSGDKSTFFLHHFGWENYQKNVYPYGFLILISQADFMGTPNSVRMLYNDTVLTES
jgi:hypothetical protein